MDSFIDREVAASVVKKRRHYTSKQRILLVGEGDFSFSLSLASAFGFATGMVATSLDSKATSNVKRLRQLGCKVLHGIDATTMSKNRSLRRAKKFDRIVYNFPHAGFICPEASAFQIELHKHLLMGFFENARELLSHGHGEVHVTHKQGYPYSKWELEKIAEKNGFVLVEASRFRLSDYPGYVNKRGAGSHPNRTFKVGRATTFRFKIDARLLDWPDLKSSLQMLFEFFAETANSTAATEGTKATRSAITVAEVTKATGPAITAVIKVAEGTKATDPTITAAIKVAEGMAAIKVAEGTKATGPAITTAIKVAEGTKATGPAITTAIMATNDSDEKTCLTDETAGPAFVPIEGETQLTEEIIITPTSGVVKTRKVAGKIKGTSLEAAGRPPPWAVLAVLNHDCLLLPKPFFYQSKKKKDT
ncbi:Ferredoxin-fold anticodon-binding domain-containing protein 1 [Nymphaea thermarum]|nr:Ferredoxin-fold anticodon-binding domain-containing protein 1 [Nymphaea thermarum]